MVIRLYELIGVSGQVHVTLFGIGRWKSHRPVVEVDRLWRGRMKVWTMYRHQRLLPSSYANVSERSEREERVRYRSEDR